MSRFIDHSGDVLSALREAKQAALTAMGTEAVGMIVNKMETGYARRIWRTGDLQRDVAYDNLKPDEGSVDVGNGLNYAPFVHDGTRRMAARPYITDALTSGDAQQALKGVAEEAIRSVMK